MKTSEQINELTTALAAAHLEIGTIPMTGTNPHFKSKYAKLSDIYSATNIPLAKNGLCIAQSSSLFEGKVYVTTRLFHKSGQWLESELPLKPANELPQAVGSAISYGRRYEVGSILGIAAEEEDDGESAEGRAKSESEQTINNLTRELEKANREIARLKQELAPKVFNAKDGKHLEWLEKHLKDKNLDSQSMDKILTALNGKPFQELPAILKQVLEGQAHG